MEQDISIWQLVADATLPVQGVMLLLVLASIVSWGMIFMRWKAISSADKSMDQFEDRFWSGVDLGRLYVQVNNDPDENSGLEHIFIAGFKEFARLRQQSHADADAVMDGAERAMRVALAREQEKLETHLSFLATVGSTSPYIGLLGTVWGIMNSFLSLAALKQATIAVVAPGIAEALIATAAGLFAAIPAVIAYNRYASQTDRLLANYDTFSEEFSSILHRKVHAQEQEQTS